MAKSSLSIKNITKSKHTKTKTKTKSRKSKIKKTQTKSRKSKIKKTKTKTKSTKSKIKKTKPKTKTKSTKSKIKKTKTKRRKSKIKKTKVKSFDLNRIRLDELQQLSTSQLKNIAKSVNLPLRTVIDKKDLISALDIHTQFSIGWRWKYIKPHLQPSEYRNVFDLLLCPIRNISKFPKINSFLKNHEVHISMTTSPLRLPKILAVLATLDTTLVKDINVVLPEKYGKNQELYNQNDIDKISQFPKVKIVRTEIDYGPITKMLPVIRKVQDPKSIIISVDDDTGYPIGMINEFIYQKVEKYPNSIIESTDEGQEFRNEISNFNQIFPLEKKPKKPFAEMVEGWLGVAYSKKLVNDEEMEQITKLSKECLLSDDLVISYVVAKHKIPVVKVDNRYLGQQVSYLYGAGDDALFKGGGTGTIANVGIFNDSFNKQKYEICLYDIKRYL